MSVAQQQALFAGIALCALATAVFAGQSTHIEEKDDGVSVIHIVNDDNGKFVYRSDAVDLTADWNGVFTFSADGTRIETLDGKLDIEEERDGVRRRATFTGDGAVRATRFDIDGRRQPDGAASDAAVEALVLSFVRVSGMRADERVAAMLRDGGTASVIEEIDAIGAGHAAQRYVRALAEQADLSDAELRRLAAMIADFDGDHGKRKAIGALLEYQTITPAALEALLTAAEGIEGDHELRKLLEAAVAGDLSAGGSATAFKLLARISGDHEYRKAAEALLDNKTFADSDAARLMELAPKTIGSNHDLRKLLEHASARVEQSPAVAAAAIDAVRAVGSDDDLRKAIEILASALPANSPHWPALIDAAGAIGSDHELRKAVEILHGAAPGRPEAARAIRELAHSIGSDHEREAALESIGAR